jgi:hypothetical protein
MIAKLQLEVQRQRQDLIEAIGDFRKHQQRSEAMEKVLRELYLDMDLVPAPDNLPQTESWFKKLPGCGGAQDGSKEK